jgi:hypothetical protein
MSTCQMRMLHEQLDGATSWHQSSQEVDSGLLSHFLTAQCQLTRLEDGVLLSIIAETITRTLGISLMPPDHAKVFGLKSVPFR